MTGNQLVWTWFVFLSFLAHQFFPRLSYLNHNVQNLWLSKTPVSFCSPYWWLSHEELSSIFCCGFLTQEWHDELGLTSSSVVTSLNLVDRCVIIFFNNNNNYSGMSCLSNSISVSPWKKKVLHLVYRLLKWNAQSSYRKMLFPCYLCRLINQSGSGKQGILRYFCGSIFSLNFWSGTFLVFFTFRDFFCFGIFTFRLDERNQGSINTWIEV